MRHKRNNFGVTANPRWLESSRPAFAFCLFLFFLFTFFFVIFILFIPAFHTDKYIHIADPLAILDDGEPHDDWHDHHYRSVSNVGMREILLPGDKKTMVLRMPYPVGVDEEIMDARHDKCGNYSLYACGKWEGTSGEHGDWDDRAFGSAARDASHRLDVVLQLEASQFSQKVARDGNGIRDERSIGSGGAFHDIVISCINTALFPEESSDLDYARATLEQFLPTGAGDQSAAYLGGYATGVAVVYGDKPGVSIMMTMNPAKMQESVLEWTLSSQVLSFFLLTEGQVNDQVDAACRTLMAVELFPWDMWPTQDECVADFRSLIAALMSTSSQADRTAANVNLDYIQSSIEDDLYTRAEWEDLVGTDFSRGVEDGMLSAMRTFATVLEQEGLGIPDISALRRWTRYKALVQFISKTAEQPRWRYFVCAMFVMGNYQYEDALLRDPIGSDAALTRWISSQSSKHAPFDITKNVDSKVWRFSRDLKNRLASAKHAHNKEERKVARQSLLGDDPLALSALVRSDLWRRCTWLSMEYMPAEIDNSVARIAVPNTARARVHEITAMIVAAMAEDVRASPLLSDEGKAAIINKLSGIRAHVAVPWDTDGTQTTPPLSVPYDVDASASFARNARQARARNVIQGMIEGARSHGRAPSERPLLSHTFDMPTSAVNAYYDPTSNQIFFMAGILTPPFFSLKYDDATQLATLGAIIGHEVAHAFDSSGKYFQKDGSVGKFLPADVEKRYADAEQCFVLQYSAIPTPNGNTVDGEQTLGENMADVMGLRAAYRALWNLHKDRDDVPQEIKKEFVEAYSQMWCTSISKKNEAERAKVDVHAPGSARIQGALRNLVDPKGNHVLESVYGCKLGQAMRPLKTCSVW